MKVWAWRAAMILLSLAAAYVLAARTSWRRRAAGIFAVAACFVVGVLLALTRLPAYRVVDEFTSRSSILWWVAVVEVLGLAAWLLVFSREPWRRRAARVALVALVGAGILTYEAYRFYASGITQELMQV